MGFKDFLQGISKPSGLSVGVMLTTCLACAAATILLLPGFMGGNPGDLLASSRKDHHFFVTSELFKIENLDSKKPILAVIGASVTLSSFGGTDQIAAVMRDISGREFEVLNLTTGRQNLLEHVLMLEHMPDDRPVYVVLGVGPSRFTWRPESYVRAFNESRFGKLAPLFVERIAELGKITRPLIGLPAIDSSGFYISRLRRIPVNFLYIINGRDRSRDENQYVDKTLSRNAYEAHARRVLSRFNGAEEAISDNHQRLSEILAYVKVRSNIRLIVIEHPIRPEFVTDFLGVDRYAQHLNDMRKIMVESGFTYFVPAPEAGLVNDDYYDWAHIRKEGAQDKLRNIVFNKVLEVSNE